jgi:hypothetical protein
MVWILVILLQIQSPASEVISWIGPISGEGLTVIQFWRLQVLERCNVKT